METRDPEQSPRTLYRDPDNGKICGVCAGVAEYFGFETWVVRVIAVSLLLFLNGGMVLGYVIACWVLEVKPGSESSSKRYFRGTKKSNQYGYGRDSEETASSKKSRYKPNVQDVWKRGTSPASTVQRVRKKLSKIEQKLRPMESFVTSDKFALDKEFESIQDSKPESVVNKD